MELNDFWYDVLDFGNVALIDKMGTDLSVYNAAQASFAKRSDELTERSIGVINFMMRERHGSPFEHMVMTLLIKCPIFVAREWFRHRMSSFNEWSARYSKLQPEFYIPESENVRTQTGKPGGYVFNVLEEEKAQLTRSRLTVSYQVAWDNYEAMLESGVAKEQARLVLPVATYTQFYWTVNARSLMNFLNLRNADTAQWEIRQYAVAVEDIFSKIWPVTHEAFLANDRVAP